MESLACDKNNPEDVDTDQEDHAFDTLKYGLTNERRAVEKKPVQRQLLPAWDIKNI
jgi:hypothetical protein